MAISLEQYCMVEAPVNGYWLQSGSSRGEKASWEVQKLVGKIFVVLITILKDMCSVTYQKNRKASFFLAIKMYNSF